jgi:hypothetical protein
MWSRLLVLLLVVPAGSVLSAQKACPPGEHWVNAYHRRAYSRGDGTFVSAADVKAHCHGNPANYHFWVSKLKSGRPLWRPDAEKASDWAAEEVERVLEVLDETPNLLKDNNIKAIYRLKESIPPGNPASTNLNDIVLYDDAFEPPFNLTHVLDHELSHRVFEKLSDGEKGSFRRIAKWKKDSRVKDHFTPKRSDKEYVRPNAMLSPEEDFADDLTEYVHQPAKLEKMYPPIFDWMKKHIGPKLKNGGSQ